jgi:hypothetical protein
MDSSHDIYLPGNEADYILVSVVRTEGAGFLRSLNRMNVMLTRAKKGMVIVTSSLFLRSGVGARTLLGRLAQYWETRKQDTWIDWRRVADGTTNLPGSPGTPSLAGLDLRSAVAHSRTFPRVAAVPAPEKPALSPSTIAAHTADTGEEWRRPEIRQSDFPPLTSRPTFVHRAKVGSENPLSLQLKIFIPARARPGCDSNMAHTSGISGFLAHPQFNHTTGIDIGTCSPSEGRIRELIQYPTQNICTSPCTVRIRLTHGPSVRHRRVLGAPPIKPHHRWCRVVMTFRRFGKTVFRLHVQTPSVRATS